MQKNHESTGYYLSLIAPPTGFPACLGLMDFPVKISTLGRRQSKRPRICRGDRWTFGLYMFWIFGVLLPPSGFFRFSRNLLVLGHGGSLHSIFLVLFLFEPFQRSLVRAFLPFPSPECYDIVSALLPPVQILLNLA